MFSVSLFICLPLASCRGFFIGLIDMRAADSFYKTPSWIKTRNAYAASVGHLCERCLSYGRYEPGEIVHHKIHLTPDNYNDPTISLNWDNLELLCRKCHAEMHPEVYKKKYKKRFFVDEFGRISSRQNDEKLF